MISFRQFFKSRRYLKSTALLWVAGSVASVGAAKAAVAAPSDVTRIVVEREPNGGQWKPIVIRAGSSLPLAAPPASASTALATELRELLDLQARRTPATDATVRFWDGRAVVRWNEIARGLVIKHRTLPPIASRVYALLSIAQYDALVATWNNKYRHRRNSPSQFDARIRPVVNSSGEPVYPSEAAVVAAASAGVLEGLYVDETEFLEGKVQEHEMSRLWGGLNFRSDVQAGDALGRTVAARVLAYAQNDGADATGAVAIPVGPDKWTGQDPALPMWGKVRPWLLGDITSLRPPPPPAMDSPEFKTALAEVRRISDTRTPEQLRIAQFWADGAGTYTPPGHWNAIACDYIVERNQNELRAARTLALMNMAVMDAGICCWDAKYAYWLLRPFQADPAITTPVGKPNFPSYTSGHATFSGAASEVLAYLFPKHGAEVRAMAEEAALSRLYGGIHFRFDNDRGLEGGRSIANDAGLVNGRRVAAASVRRAQTDGADAP